MNCVTRKYGCSYAGYIGIHPRWIFARPTMNTEVGVYESRIFKGNMSQATKMTGAVSSEI
jgi:hypothetical protein